MLKIAQKSGFHGINDLVSIHTPSKTKYNVCLTRGIKFYVVVILLLFISLNSVKSYAQCDTITPSFIVNLSSSAANSWISTSVVRDGYCCGATGSSRCIKFELTLHPDAAGILFEIVSGAIPGGSMYYQVGCSSPTTVGQPLCLTGTGPHIITFCKPGANVNTYSIKSFPKPSASSDIIVNEGCIGKIGSEGYDITTINWTSVYPGVIGAYNSYLDCTTCDTVNVQASAGYPPYVDYQVCGYPEGSCDTNATCDTIRVFFSSTLGVQILPLVPTLCIGDTSVTLIANGIGGTPPYSFAWSTSSTLDSIYADTGTYIVAIMDSSGCPGTSDTVTVTAFASAITANAGADQFICSQYDTINLSGIVTAASGGTWSGGAGSYSPSKDSLNTIYTATAGEITSGQLQLILTTSGNGSCPEEKDTTIIYFSTFDAIPVLNKQNVQCNGQDNGNANVSITGGKPPFTYQWNTTPPSTNTSVNTLTPGNYSVTITDSLGCDSILPFVITEPDTFGVQSVIQDVACYGEFTASINITVIGAVSPYQFQWSNSTNNEDLISIVAGTYIVTITDANLCDTAISYIVNQPTILGVSYTKQDVTCNGGSNGSIDLTVNGGSPSYFFNWSNSVSTEDLNGLSAGTYSVTVSDQNGCDSVLSITINQPVQVIASVSGPASICNGEVTTLTASGANTYEWSPSTGLSSTSGTIVSASPSSSQTYTVVATDLAGCKDTAIYSLSVLTKPNVTVNPSSTGICPGGSENLLASGASTYSWSPSTGLNVNNIANVIASPAVSTTYILIGTASNGCKDTTQVPVIVYTPPTVTATPVSLGICINDTTTINASGAVSYSWYPATNISSASANPVSVYPPATTTYHVIGMDANGCKDTAHIPITVNPLPVMNMTSPNSFICTGDTANITATGAVSYSWTPTTNITPITGANVSCFPSVTTQYIVTGTDANGCKDTVSTTISVNPLPTVAINPSLDTICVQDSITLSASGGVSYLWSPAASLSASTGASVNAGPVVTTSYIVSATDANNCKNSDTAQIVVMMQPVVTATPVSSGICINDSTSISASGGISYSWYPSTNISSTSGSPVFVYPTTSSIYHVIGTDANGCKDTAHIPITVNPLPVMNMTPPNSFICAGDTANITATGAVSYSWTPTTNITPITGANVSCFPSVTTQYIVTGTDANGCKDTVSTTISVNPLPTVAINPSLDTICVQDSITLSASGGVSYLWSPAASLSASTGASVNAGPVVTTSYIVSATDANNCKNSDTAQIVVMMQPVVTATPVSSGICINDSTSISASGGISYSWYPSTNISSTSGSPVFVYPTTSSIYHVIGTDANGCKDTAHIPITVNPLPVMNMTPPNSFICAGDTANITATGAVSYSWTPTTNITPITGANVSCFPSVTTQYIVTGTDANGCKDTVSTTISVNPLPTVAINPSLDTICVQDSITLSASGGVSYLWSPAASLSASTGASVNAGPVVTTSYIVSATDANNCKNSDTAQIVVMMQPVVTATPVSSGICINDSTSISASGGISYSWYPSTNISSTSGSPVFVYPTTSSIYHVIGTDANGCKDTAHIPITVNPLPVMNMTPANSIICQGDTTSISATGALTYSWTPTTNINPSTGANIAAFPTITTTYTVLGTDINGCKDTLSTTVTVNQLPLITVMSDTTYICMWLSDTINVSGASNYIWSPSVGLSTTTGNQVIANPVSSTNYMVVGTDSNNCKDTANAVVITYSNPSISVLPNNPTICDSSSILLVASGTINYFWSPAAGLNVNNNDSVTATPINSTTYTVIGLDINGCSDTATSIVTVTPNPIVTSTYASICLGDTAILKATSTFPNASFLWSTNSTVDSIIVNPITTSTYTVTATDTNGCDGSANTIVTVHPLPPVSVSPSNSTICIGDSIQLNSTGANFYIWSPVMGLSATNIDTVLAYPTTSTTYEVIGTDSFGCSDTSNVIVNVNPKPLMSLNSSSSVICDGDSTILIVTGANSYQWSPSAGLSATTGDTVIANPSVSTTYSVVGTNGFGCMDSILHIITVNNIPSISVTPPSAAICMNDSVTLNATGALTYSWSPSSGLLSSTGSTVIANPVSTSTYTITGTDINGCMDTTQVIVTVNPLPTVSISPVNPSICFGYPVNLNASGAINYQWSPVSGLSSSSGASVNAGPTSTTSYTVTGTDNNGCKDTSTVLVTVNPTPVLSLSSTSNVICDGDTTVLSVNGAASYQWWPAIGLSASTGASVMAFPNTTTTYTVVGVNSSGCTDTATIVVTVNPNPAVSVVTSSQALCIGDFASLTASGANSYSWSPSTGLNSTTGSTVIANPITTTTYIVTGTDINGCKDTSTVIITVHPLPVVNVNPTDTLLCDGDSIYLIVNGANSYSWTPALGLSSITGDTVLAIPQTSTTYVVTGTDLNGCQDTASVKLTMSPNPIITPNNPTICEGFSTTLTVTSTLGGTTYNWNTGPTTSSITVAPLITSTYTVTGTDTNGCVGVSASIVTVLTKPTIIITPASPIICLGDSVNLIATGANNYIWSPSSNLSTPFGDSIYAFPQSTTTYSVVADSFGCSDTASVVVTINPKPTLTLSPSSNNVCEGLSIYILASGAQNYTWSPSSTLSSSSGDSVTATPVSTTNYIVLGVDSNGCSDTISTTILFHPKPNLSISPPLSGICYGDTTALSVSGAIIYNWTPSSSLSSSTGSIVSAFPLSTTTYSIEGTDVYGCKDTISAIVSVYPLPIVTINPDSSIICEYDTISLNAIGANIYQWSPGSSLSSTTGFQVSAYPMTTANYSVVGIDTNGCIGNASAFVLVNPKPNISINPAVSTLCINDSTTLTVSSNISLTTYLWNTSSTSDSIIAAPTTTTTYTVTGTTPVGCVGIGSSTVNINPLPNVSATPDSSVICIGLSTSLSATGASTYQWSPATGLSSTSGAIVTASPQITTTYTIIGTDSNGCSNVDLAVVIVKPLPNIVVNPDSSIICEDDTVILNVSGASLYQWASASGLSSTTGSQVAAIPLSTITYKVVGIDAFGCIDSSTTFINVKPKPIININPSFSTICVGDSTILSVSSNIPSTTYLWSTSITNDTILVKPSVPTTYTVTSTTSFGCKKTDTSIVNLNPLPQISVTPDSSIICIGLSTNLTVSGASTYQWSPTNGLSASVGSNITAAPIITTDYTVIGTDTNGCRDTASANVFVKPLPNIVITPDSSVICEDDTIMFNVSGANTYLWAPSSGLSSTSGSQITVIPLSTITYTVIGTDTNGCIDSSTAFIHVNPKPNTSINPSVAAICIGDSTTLTAISNVPGTTYLWNTNSTMNSISVTPSVSSTYTVTATTLQNCSDTAFSIVNIHPYPVVNILPNNPVLCKGDSMWLKASSNISNLNYTWSTSATSDSICISPTVTTTYSLIGMDTAGCSGYDTTIIIPHQKPSVSYTTNNTTICTGDTAIINAVSSYTGLTYLWSTGAPTPQIIVSPLTVTTYTVTATDTFGCFDTAVAVIYINPIPVLTIVPNNPIICNGDTTTLIASSSVLNVNYQWSNGALINSTIVNPGITTTYTVTGTDIIGCAGSDTCVVTVEYGPPVSISPTNPEICLGDTATLTASSTVAGVTFLWNTSTSGNTVTVNPLVNTLYYVVGSNANGCKDTAQALLIVNPNPVINISPNNSGICLWDSIQLTANSNIPIVTYQWSNGYTVNPIYFKPTITSSIIVIGEDSNTCKGSDTAYVVVTTTPTSIINAISPICSADSTIITYSGTGTTSATYNWNFDGGGIISGTSQGPYAIKWTNGGIYNVTLTVSENNCTSAPDTAQIIVNQTPVVDFSANPVSACEYAEVQFTNLTPNIANFTWNFGDPMSPDNTSNLEHPLHIYNISGLYNIILSVMSNDGCPATLTKLGFISVNPNPEAAFNFTPDFPDIENPIVEFYNLSIGSTAWSWDFGDPGSGVNNFSNLFSPSHLFSDTGIFLVWLIAENTFGCLDTAMLEVPVKDVSRIHVPNAFTPANGGENSLFFPKGYNIDWNTLEFYIFDRWGEQIYFTKDVNMGWDGTKNGGSEICQQGVYAWLLIVKDIYGEKIRLKGTVTLLR